MTIQTQIEELARSKLLGRRIDAVGFVEELLALASREGEIHCTFVDNDALRFTLSGQQLVFEVPVDAARGKLRMMCARLGVLCNESGDQGVSLFGGEGVIEKAPASSVKSVIDGNRNRYPSGDPPGTAPVVMEVTSPAPDHDRMTWKVSFKNTPSAHEFTIQKT